ncbi:MAG TPA: c-type cytochrome [Gemmatimonadaceae bacterium]
MRNRIIVMAAMVTLLAASGLAGAQDKPKIVNKPPPFVEGGDAPGMFREYCAPCHGVTGRGDGPAAPALKAVPADLTRLSARNGGKFPDARVRRYIEGLDEISAHGSRDMPIWGRALRGLPGGESGMRLRIEALTRHLESLQQK